MNSPRIPFRNRAARGVLLLAATVSVGCEQKLDPQRYGQIIPELPQIKGADKPYPLPQLEEPSDEASDSQK